METKSGKKGEERTRTAPAPAVDDADTPPGDGGASPAQSSAEPGPPPHPQDADSGAQEPLRLYTRCPTCKALYRIGIAQLRNGRGEAWCPRCQIVFNALDALADSAARAAACPARPSQAFQPSRLEAIEPAAAKKAGLAAPRISAMPPLASLEETTDRLAGWDARIEDGARGSAPAARIAWGLGVFLLLAALGGQFWLFEGPRWMQDESLRPWLETACRSLRCQLPVFRAPGRIQIIDHALHPAPDGSEGYEFLLVLANQASLPQAFPAVKLVLSGNDGRPAAARIFRPEEYLPKSATKLMPVGQPQEIRLLLAKPQREIGGFSFELL